MRRALVLLALAACGGSSKPSSSPPAPSNELSNTTGATEPATGAALKLTGVDPPRGDPEGGTYVRLTGTGFIIPKPRTWQVYFGSRQAVIVRFASDSELIVEAPRGKAGETVDILAIVDPGGQLRLPNAFTFVARPVPP
jgi:hypothetical protein